MWSRSSYQSFDDGDGGESAPASQAQRSQQARPAQRNQQTTQRPAAQAATKPQPRPERTAAPLAGTVVVRCGVCHARFQKNVACEAFRCDSCGAMVSQTMVSQGYSNAPQPAASPQINVVINQNSEPARRSHKSKKEKKKKKRDSSSSENSSCSRSSSSSSGGRTKRKLRALERKLKALENVQGGSQQQVVQQGYLLLQGHSSLDDRELQRRLEDMDHRLGGLQLVPASTAVVPVSHSGSQGSGSNPWPPWPGTASSGPGGSHMQHGSPAGSPTNGYAAGGASQWPADRRGSGFNPFGTGGAPSSQYGGGGADATAWPPRDASGWPRTDGGAQAWKQTEGMQPWTPSPNRGDVQSSALVPATSGAPSPTTNPFSDSFPNQSAIESQRRGSLGPHHGQQSVTVQIPDGFAQMSSEELMLLAQAKRYAESQAAQSGRGQYPS